MPVLIRYAPPGLTRAQYDEVSEKIEASGSWPPDGLVAHVSFGPDGDMRVSEVWESPEKLQAFQQQLMPVLKEAGVNVEGDEPEVLEVHAFEGFEFSHPTRPA